MPIGFTILRQYYKNIPICVRKYSASTFAMNKPNIKTFIFLDSETTGLPHLESYKTRITELCMAVVQSEHLSLGVFPRVLNKLNLCFNPGKLISLEASNITGLTNELLQYQSPFQKETVDIINNLINLQEKPICLVAHNGYGFDYPILRFEINKVGSELPNDILCIDSLQAFRELYKSLIAETIVTKSTTKQIPFEFNDNFDEILCEITDDFEKNLEHKNKKSIEEIQNMNETTPQKQIIRNVPKRSIHTIPASRQLNFPRVSFKLADVFTRLTGKQPIEQHRTECDVNMLLECAATLGEKFVDWSNCNARKFCDIPMMKPGQKFGS